MTNLDKIKNKLSNMNAEQFVEFIRYFQDCRYCIYYNTDSDYDCDRNNDCKEGMIKFFEADENYKLLSKYKKIIDLMQDAVSKCDNEEEMKFLKDKINSILTLWGCPWNE